MPITINGSGTITGISAGGLPDGSVVAADLASSLDLTGKTVTLPSGTGGKILQVASALKTDAEILTASGVTYNDLTDLNVSITPVAAGSQIMVTGHISGLCNSGTQASIHVFRGSTEIGQADAASSRRRCHGNIIGNLDTSVLPNWTITTSAINALDTPTYTLGDTITYKFQVASTGTVWINRGSRDTDGTNWDFRTVSNITVMEVAA